MAGKVTNLQFAEGTDVSAPSQNFLSASALITKTSSAQYVTDKGSAAAEGDIFGNTTSNKINYYDGTAWRELSASLNNFSASTDPGVSDDDSAGYAVGSIWINTTASPEKIWMCVDASTGAAVWNEVVNANQTQTISGAKTFSSAVTVSDTTTSTNKDTGSIVTEGGVGIEENLNVGGNAIITGDLTVNGTTTTVNTATLDVTDANITINDGGNQASADGVAGITVEMSDATDTAIIYDASLTSRFKCGDSGSEVEMATVSGQQVITNKDIDGGTASNTSRVTLPKDTTTNLNALTDKEATIAYDTTKATLVVNDGSTWNEISGGAAGGINHIGNPGAESDTSGWATYADAAGESPVDGTGGSPTVTWTRNTSSPLRDTADFLLTKDAADRQGEGASYDFTIDETDQASTLTISFDATTSANYADDDIGVFIYDVTNAAIIEPVGKNLKAGTNGIFSTQFQAASNSTSYRLIIHVASTNASAYTVNIDNVRVGPSQRSFGAPVTDWIDFTPTGGWNTNTTYTGRYRRVGDTMDLHITVETTGAPNVASLTLDMPSGFTIDTSKLSSSDTNTTLIGDVTLSDSSAGQRYTLSNVNYSDSTTLLIRYDNGATSGQSSAQVNATSPFTWASGDKAYIRATVPISGWGSSVQMSDSDDGRLVAARFSTNAAQTVNNGNTDIIDFEDIDYDTHGAVTTGASWNFTAPSSGKYRITSFVQTGGATPSSINSSCTTLLYKNGSLEQYLGSVAAEQTSSSVNVRITSSGTIDLDQGDYIDLRFSNNWGVNLSFSGFNDRVWIAIEKVQGPSAIAANELIAARYTTNAGQSLGTGSLDTIDFEDVDFDTHGAVTTGASWVFTAPVSGKYQIKASVILASNSGWSAGESFQCEIHKNASAITRDLYFFQDNGGAVGLQATTSSSTIAHLDAGDTLEFKVRQSSGGSITLTGNAKDNYISVHRIGF